MMHHKWLLVTLVVLGFAEVAPCEAGETVVLRAQLKLLQSKVDRQAGELKALRERIEQLRQANARLKDLCDRAAIDTKVPEAPDPAAKPEPDQKPVGGSATPTAKSIPVSFKQVLAYTFHQTGAAEKEKMSIGRTKVIERALAKTKAMLARGPITLTYRVITLDTEKEGEVKLNVGYPREVLDACVAAKTLTLKKAMSLEMRSYGTFSIALSSKQALTVRKGAKIILRGKASLPDKSPSRKSSAGSMVVFRPYGWPTPMRRSFIRRHYVLLEDSTLLLNGRKVEFAE
jgi:hypothetical protein